MQSSIISFQKHILMTKDLSQRLTAYSSIVATTLFATKIADAQVIYTNPPDILLSGAGAHAFIDLDNDGVFDLKIKVGHSYSATQSFEAIIETAGSYKLRVWDYSDCQGSFFYGYGVIPMDNGQVIPKNSGNQKGWQLASYGEIINFGYYGATCHRWAGANMKFVGLRIRNGNHKYNYAWMRLSVNQTGSEVTIHDWAFDTKVNDPFYTGQTMRSADENSPVSLQCFSYDKQIFINQNIPGNPLDISVFNLLGEEQKKVQTSDESSQWSLSDLPSGIYIVKVKSMNENISKEIIIE